MSEVKESFIWAALLHLGMNLWHDQKAPLKPVRDYLWFDDAVWRDVTQKMHDVGMNMIVIDLGEGMEFKKHPELAVKGTWSQRDFAAATQGVSDGAVDADGRKEPRHTPAFNRPCRAVHGNLTPRRTRD